MSENDEELVEKIASSISPDYTKPPLFCPYCQRNIQSSTGTLYYQRYDATSKLDIRIRCPSCDKYWTEKFEFRSWSKSGLEEHIESTILYNEGNC